MRALWLLTTLVATARLSAAEPRAVTPQINLPDPDREGQELAAKLRDAMPEGDSRFTGRFQIVTKDDDVRHVPVSSEIKVHPTNWVVTYRATPTNGAASEVLTITHVPGKPTTYSYTVGGKAITPVPLGASFAGTDFALLDLGLEFFHWPKQRRLKHEMRHSRNCHVLESTNPGATNLPYSRIQSWVDIESGGIVRAEVLDRNGSTVKEFKIGKFQKVDGRWQLESLRIGTRATGQDTELKFDLYKE